MIATCILLFSVYLFIFFLVAYIIITHEHLGAMLAFIIISSYISFIYLKYIMPWTFNYIDQILDRMETNRILKNLERQILPED